MSKAHQETQQRAWWGQTKLGEPFQAGSPHTSAANAYLLETPAGDSAKSKKPVIKHPLLKAIAQKGRQRPTTLLFQIYTSPSQKPAQRWLWKQRPPQMIAENKTASIDLQRDSEQGCESVAQHLAHSFGRGRSVSLFLC